MADEVAKVSPVQQEAIDAAHMAKTLMGGAKAMRDAGEMYLPQEDGESETAYKARLNRTDLFNAFRKTVYDMTGRALVKPPVLGEYVPTEIKGTDTTSGFIEDIDLAGRHINEFTRDILVDGLVNGISFIFVDTPSIEVETTRADQKAGNIRPFWTDIPVQAVLGWQSAVVNGKRQLTQFRFLETVEEPDGAYGTKAIEQIRVLTLGGYEIWRKKEKRDNAQDQWQLYQQGKRGLEEIPIVPFYAQRTGFMQGRSPLQDLADLNVIHWQSSSDQRQCLHIGRVGILHGWGFPEGTAENMVVSATIAYLTDGESKLGFVEHEGKALGAGWEDLDRLEKRMMALGLQMLVDDAGQTATGEVRDNVKETSRLASIVNSLKDALENALRLTAQLAGLGDDGGSVSMNTDFGLNNLGSFDLTALNMLNTMGVISRQTLIEEYKRRGVLHEDITFEQEKEHLQEEGDQEGADSLLGVNG